MILAVTVEATDVLVALIGAVGLIGVALVGTISKASNAAARAASTAEDTAGDMADRIGTPNGHRDVVQMLETILAGQAGQDRRLARLEERANTTVELIRSLFERVAELERRNK